MSRARRAVPVVLATGCSGHGGMGGHSFEWIFGALIACTVLMVIIGAFKLTRVLWGAFRRAPDREVAPQVVGRGCAACGERIVFAAEGRACDQCGAPLHVRCGGRHGHGGEERGGPYRGAR